MLKLDTNIKQVQQELAKTAKQLKFATAVALTATAGKVKDAMPRALESVLERPTEFTKRGWFVTRATPQTMEAVVGAKDKTASYLIHQVEGGTFAPKRKALRLPTAIKLNEFGNLPAGTIKQLIERAKAGKRATKGQGRRFGVSSKLELFYGDPKDKRPAGIYKRVRQGGREQLIPLIVFPRQSARYRKEFDFYGIARRIASAEFEREFEKALARALATAK